MMSKITYLYGLSRLAILSVAGMFLAACGTTYQRAYELDFVPTTPGVAVDVENFRGTVEVRVDPNQNVYKVSSSVIVSESVNKERAEAVADEVEIAADLLDQSGYSVLRVRSTAKRPDSDDYRVGLLITMPRCDGVRILNHYGDVEVVNTRGAIEIHNRKAAIEVRTSHPIMDPITLTTVDGNIYLQMPEASEGELDLQAVNGAVRFIDRMNQSNRVRFVSSNSFVSTLNDGTNQITCRTNDGVVSVWVMEEPLALTRVIRESPPSVWDMLYLKGSRRHTRNLPDDHPEVQQVQSSTHFYQEN